MSSIPDAFLDKMIIFMEEAWGSEEGFPDVEDGEDERKEAALEVQRKMRKPYTKRG